MTLISGPPALDWLRDLLANGAGLSRRLNGAIDDRLRVQAAVPSDWQPHRPDDFDTGDARVTRAEMLQFARSAIKRHSTRSQLACAIVEDSYAAPANPCREGGSLPWIIARHNDHDQLYWFGDTHDMLFRPDAVLGAVMGRRFVAILTQWEHSQPEPCSSVSEGVLDDLAANATGIIAEILDGQSYLLATLPKRKA